MHEPKNGTIRGQGHGVDFNLRSIFLLKDFIKVQKNVCCVRLCFLVLEAKLLSDTNSFSLAKAFDIIDWCRNDGGRVFGRNFFNVHASLVRSNQDDALRGPVIEDGNIVFMFWLTTFC